MQRQTENVLALPLNLQDNACVQQKAALGKKGGLHWRLCKQHDPIIGNLIL